MLIKDNILVSRLNNKTQNCFINVELSFNLNNKPVDLMFIYTPDKFKIEQASIKVYLDKLTDHESFNLEELSARITEDLYDIAVPKKIDVTIKQKIDDITISIQTSKQQPV